MGPLDFLNEMKLKGLSSIYEMWLTPLNLHTIWHLMSTYIHSRVWKFIRYFRNWCQSSRSSTTSWLKRWFEGFDLVVEMNVNWISCMSLNKASHLRASILSIVLCNQPPPKGFILNCKSLTPFTEKSLLYNGQTSNTQILTHLFHTNYQPIHQMWLALKRCFNLRPTFLRMRSNEVWYIDKLYRMFFYQS